VLGERHARISATLARAGHGHLRVSRFPAAVGQS